MYFMKFLFKKSYIAYGYMYPSRIASIYKLTTNILIILTAVITMTL